MGASSSKSELTDLDLTRFQGNWSLIGKYATPLDKIHESAAFNFTIIPGSGNTLFQVTKTCYAPNATTPVEPTSNWGLTQTTVERGIATKDKTALNIKFEDHKEPMRLNVLWTDYDNFAVLAGHKGAWILSRKANPSKTDLEMLRAKTIKLGYDPKKIFLTPNGETHFTHPQYENVMSMTGARTPSYVSPQMTSSIRSPGGRSPSYMSQAAPVNYVSPITAQGSPYVSPARVL